MTLRLKTCNRLGLNKQERDGLMLLMVVNWHLCLESNCSPSTTSVRMDASQETDTETDVETSMRDQFRNNTFQNRFLQGIEGTPQKRSEVFHPMTKPKGESDFPQSQCLFHPSHTFFLPTLAKVILSISSRIFILTNQVTTLVLILLNFLAALSTTFSFLTYFLSCLSNTMVSWFFVTSLTAPFQPFLLV